MAVMAITRRARLYSHPQSVLHKIRTEFRGWYSIRLGQSLGGNCYQTQGWVCVWGGGGLAGGWGSLPRAVGSVDGAIFYPEIGLKKEEWGDRQWWIKGGRGFNPPPPHRGISLLVSI